MKKDINMLDGPLLGNVIRYTIPIILTSFLQLLFNAADLVVVGRFCGSESVGAVGATSSLVALIVNLFNGIAIGAGVVVAQAIGAGDERQTRRTVHTAMPLAAVSGVIIAVVGMLFAPTMLKWMATPPEFIELSVLYVRIYFVGMIPGMLYNYGAAILRAAGDTKSPLYFLAIAGVLNIGLNVIFVTQLGMNVAGVALATAISQLVSCVLVMGKLMWRRDACRLEWKGLRFHRRPMGQMLTIGLPNGLQSCMFSISNILIQSSINTFGSIAVAGNTAAHNVEMFVYMAMYAFSQTSMNFVGQNIGAGKPQRIPRIYATCMGCMAVVGVVMSMTIFLFARPLLGFYITDSVEAIDIGVLRMSFVLIPYVICGALDVATGTMRGTGASLPPMIISVLGVCAFRVGWVYTVFAASRTLETLYLSYPISWTLTLIVLNVVLFRMVKRAKSLNASSADCIKQMG